MNLYFSEEKTAVFACSKSEHSAEMKKNWSVSFFFLSPKQCQDGLKKRGLVLCYAQVIVCSPYDTLLNCFYFAPCPVIKSIINKGDFWFAGHALLMNNTPRSLFLGVGIEVLAIGGLPAS